MADLATTRVMAGVAIRRTAESGTRMTWSMLGLMAYTIVQIGRPQEVVPGLDAYRLGAITVGLTLVAALLEGRLKNLRPIFHTVEMRCVLAILALGLVSAPMGVWMSGSLDVLTGEYLKVVVYFVLLQAIVRSAADVRRLAWAFTLSSLVLGGAAYLYSSGIVTPEQIRGGVGWEDGIERVAVSGTYSANELAVIIVSAIPFSLAIIRTRRSALSLLVQVVCLGLSAVVVVWTGSRTGFIALAIVVGIAMVRMGRFRAPGTLAGLAVAAGLVWIVASPAYWERLGATVSPSTQYEETYSGRSVIWKRGLNLIAARPIFGVGIGNFSIADEGINAERRGRSAHSAFVEIWAELGVGGLAALCVMFVASVGRARRVARQYRDEWLGVCAAAAEVSLIGFIIGSFVLSTQYSQILYLLVGVPLVCDRVASARATAPNPGARS